MTDREKLLAGNQWLPRDVAKLLHEAGWADERLILMTAIIRAESAMYDEAVGGPNPDGSLDYGLFQINSSHASQFGFTDPDAFKAACFDPHVAVHFARTLYIKANYMLSPWAAYTNGSYEQFKRMAVLGVANFWASVYGVDLLHG